MANSIATPSVTMPEELAWCGLRKRVSDASYPNADAYQMLAYCTRPGLDEGWLVYADLDGGRAVSRVIRNAGVTIRVESIDLGGPIERLKASVRALAGQLAVDRTCTAELRSRRRS